MATRSRLTVAAPDCPVHTTAEGLCLSMPLTSLDFTSSYMRGIISTATSYPLKAWPSSLLQAYTEGLTWPPPKGSKPVRSTFPVIASQVDWPLERKTLSGDEWICHHELEDVGAAPRRGAGPPIQAGRRRRLRGGGERLRRNHHIGDGTRRGGGPRRGDPWPQRPGGLPGLQGLPRLRGRQVRQQDKGRSVHPRRRGVQRHQEPRGPPPPRRPQG